jgi:hypothetical protein
MKFAVHVFFLFCELYVFLGTCPEFVADREKGKHQRKLPVGNRTAQAARNRMNRSAELESSSCSWCSRQALRSLPRTESPTFICGKVEMSKERSTTRGTFHSEREAGASNEGTPRNSSQQPDSKANEPDPQKRTGSSTSKDGFVFAGSGQWFHGLTPDWLPFVQRVLILWQRVERLSGCLLRWPVKLCCHSGWH